MRSAPKIIFCQVREILKAHCSNSPSLGFISVSKKRFLKFPSIPKGFARKLAKEEPCTSVNVKTSPEKYSNDPKTRFFLVELRVITFRNRKDKLTRINTLKNDMIWDNLRGSISNDHKVSVSEYQRLGDQILFHSKNAPQTPYCDTEAAKQYSSVTGEELLIIFRTKKIVVVIIPKPNKTRNL